MKKNVLLEVNVVNILHTSFPKGCVYSYLSQPLLKIVSSIRRGQMSEKKADHSFLTSGVSCDPTEVWKSVHAVRKQFDVNNRPTWSTRCVFRATATWPQCFCCLNLNSTFYPFPAVLVHLELELFFPSVERNRFVSAGTGPSPDLLQ